jgi:uncharacterized membrane protein
MLIRHRPLVVRMLPCLLVCLAGGILRFANLGGKVCYLDESATALRVGGHTVVEFCEFLDRSEAVPPAAIRRFQRLEATRGVGDTVRALMREEPQHPPLFYALERMWAGVAGDSLAALRAGAAVLAVLAVPGLVWLGRELWQNQATTRAALMLWSCSPFFVVYAQDAREYGLWSALTILASAALLRAARTDRGWWCYGAIATAGLYTTLLFAAVLTAHAAWLATDRLARCRWRGLTAAWALAIVCFSPWVVIGWEHRNEGLDQVAWMAVPRSFVALMRAWIFGIGAVVYDVRLSPGDDPWLGLIGCGVAVAVIVGAVAWWRSPDRRGAMFAMFLIAANAAPLAAADVMLGGCRSTVPRFLVASWVGELLVLAWLASRRQWLLATAIVLGLTAGLVRMPSQTSWHKYSGPRHLRLATAVNAARSPLLLAVPQGHHFNLLTLSHSLGDHVRIGSRSRSHEAERFSDVFILLRPEVSAAQPPPSEASLVLDTGAEQLWRLPSGAGGVTPPEARSLDAR